jgi:DNA-binding NtrC family response regulator
MAETPQRLLLIDPNEADVRSLLALAREVGLVVESVSDGKEGFERAMADEFDAVLLDATVAKGVDPQGLGLVSQLHARRPRLPVIVVSGEGSSGSAIDAIKRGAFDFLAKPVGKQDFQKVLDAALAASRRMTKPVSIGRATGGRDTLIGESRAMMEVYKDLGRISPMPVTVLLRGETGTGKELVARALYQHGHRAHMPFIAVNCAAIPESLLESELFGHEKGAFTGADTMRIGRFEQAHNATLFLDEIGDLDFSLQSKLLRVLQEKQIQRVGGRIEIPVDVRIIAATHRNLESMIADGSFREDLFYRLNVASIRIPALRERRSDIPLLVEHFASLVAAEFGLESVALANDVTDFLRQQPWPGNVRQLQNVIRKAVLKARSYGIRVADLREILEETRQPVRSETPHGLHELITDALRRSIDGESPGAHALLMARVEGDLLAEAIALSGGNQAKAARWLGISRLTLREKLRHYHLHPAERAKPSPPHPTDR